MATGHPTKCHPFTSMGSTYRVEKRPVVVRTIRLDRVVCKDFAADDHLPLSSLRQVLSPRRVAQARQQTNGIGSARRGCRSDRSTRVCPNGYPWTQLQNETPRMGGGEDPPMNAHASPPFWIRVLRRRGESYHGSRERTGGTCPPRPPKWRQNPRRITLPALNRALLFVASHQNGSLAPDSRAARICPRPRCRLKPPPAGILVRS